MKKIFTFLIICLFVNVTFSQQNWCSTSEADKLLKERLTEQQLQKRAEIETLINNKAQARVRTGSKRSSELKIIPVVVHIIHDNGVGDIDDSKVHEVIRTLNEDYRRLNFDTTETRDLFKNIAGSTGFEFRLATKDPNGNSTTGITRTSSSLTNDARDDVKAVSYWNSQNYFNIWVVRSIENSHGGGGTVLGYAQFPSSWGGGVDDTYGLVIRGDEMHYGNRTITHEVGHCFMLYHTFEGECGTSCDWSGDEVCDTPPSFEDTYACDNAQNSCSNDVSGPSGFSSNVVDQIENYMSYDGGCQNMFSKGQVIRMEETVNTINGLINLTSETNLTETGVNQLTGVDFLVSKKIVCYGNYSTLIDKSTYGTSTNWKVTNNNGYIENFSGNYSIVNFPNSGLYNVALDVSDGSQTLSKTKNNEIFVLKAIGSSMPYSEGFENEITLPNDNWLSVNIGSDDRKWEVTSEAAYSGTKALKLSNFGNVKGRVDAIYSNSIDLSPMQSVTLSMKVAFAQVGSSKDKIEVWAYKNCASDSMPMGAFSSGASLAGINSAQDTEFIPTSTSQWKEISFKVLSTTYLTENFIFKIKFVSDSGNNVFIDNINFSGTYKTYPILQSPTDGRLEVADNVTLDWKAIDAIDEYEYELDTTDQFNSSLLQTGTKTFISVDPTGEDTQFETSGLIWGETYYWRVRAKQGGVASQWSSIWSFTVNQNGVGIKDLERDIKISVVPNPVYNEASLRFDLKKDVNVNVSIVNILGQQNGLVSGHKLLSGENLIKLNTSHLPEGIYFVVVNDGLTTQTVKFVKK